MVLAHLNLLRKIVGIIGNIIALCLFLSPTPTFVEIVKKKSVEKYSPIPYLATLINCLVRGFYGFPVVHPDSTLIVTLSGVGVVIEIVFLTIFFIYCGRKKQRFVISGVLAAEFAFVAILAVLVLTRQHTTDQRTVSVGIACCVFNTILYVSPMPVMKMVIKTKSVEFMPFWLSVACFLNGGVWTLYGFLPFDPFMAIPNGFGCVCGLSQLIMYATYYKSTKRIMAERQKLPAQVGEMGLSNAIVDAESEQIANFNLQGFGI